MEENALVAFEKSDSLYFPKSAEKFTLVQNPKDKKQKQIQITVYGFRTSDIKFESVVNTVEADSGKSFKLKLCKK